MSESDDRPGPAENSEIAGNQALALDELEAAVRTAAKASPLLGVPGAMPAGRSESPPGSADRGPEDPINEVADDLLQLLRDVDGVRKQQSEMREQLHGLAQIVAQSSSATAHELAQIREQLLSERRGLAQRSILEALIRPYENLRTMSETGRPKKTPRSKSKRNTASSVRSDREAVRNQIRAATVILERVFLDLGFEPFTVKVGDRFDSNTMASCGHAKGDPGVVLKAVEAGFKAGDTVVIPARVVIAEPILRAPEPHKEEGT